MTKKIRTEIEVIRWGVKSTCDTRVLFSLSKKGGLLESKSEGGMKKVHVYPDRN